MAWLHQFWYIQYKSTGNKVVDHTDSKLYVLEDVAYVRQVPPIQYPTVRHVTKFNSRKFWARGHRIFLGPQIEWLWWLGGISRVFVHPVFQGPNANTAKQ